MSEFHVSFGDRGVDLDSVVDVNLSLKVVHAMYRGALLFVSGSFVSLLLSNCLLFLLTIV
eukprot:SAG11_NODE_330_length_10677_cov_8.535117_8_plen_60_part_00